LCKKQKTCGNWNERMKIACEPKTHSSTGNYPITLC
jgi:hypothetical protein